MNTNSICIVLLISIAASSCANQAPRLDGVGQEPMCGISNLECGSEPKPPPEPRTPEPRTPEPKVGVIERLIIGIYFHIKYRCSSGSIGSGASAGETQAIELARTDCGD